MDKEIKNITLKFQCNADLNSMETIEGVSFCNHCQKKVYDFSNAKQEEFLRLMAENENNLCGKFREDQIVKKQSIVPAWQKWLSAAMILVGVNIFGSNAKAQQPKIDKTQQKTDASNLTVGVIMPSAYDSMPDFPGGILGYEIFLKRNLRYKKGMINGRVIAEFTINKDGTLSNIKITRGVSAQNDREVLRVLNLSPKWKPATLNGKAIATNYSIPVNFQK